MTPFNNIFEAATGNHPYPFQRRFAECADLHELVSVPTGLGKTGMAVLGWLWRRRFAEMAVRAATPLRLVYCLPMRVLVEQTRNVVHQWLRNLKLADDVRVTVLMGGEESDSWDLYPEREAILIGTQDMLLSRALNRGYGMSRARWPLAFGLLNTDCLWVFDEIQLMGSGLATTAQLDAFRRMLPSSDRADFVSGRGCRSVWMSATMQRDWLKTVDFDPSSPRMLQLEADDLGNNDISQRHKARKPLSKAKAMMGEWEELAEQVVKRHNDVKGRTLVVVNTVKRTRNLFDAMQKYLSVPEEISRDPQAIERFRREARAASALNHAHICTIYEIDSHHGKHFIPMKYLEGQTPKHRVSGKPLKVELVLDWGIQIAGALMPRTPKESSIAMSSRHIGLQP